MSHLPNDFEKKMANVSLNSLSNYLSSRDYKSISLSLIQSRPELLKTIVKEILTTLKTDEEMYNLLIGITEYLKNDINCWQGSEHIKAIFNEIDDVYFHLYPVGKSDKAVHQKFNTILENVFSHCFNDVIIQLDRLLADQQELHLFQLSSILINFTQLLDIKNYEPILYPMAQFCETLFLKYNKHTNTQLQLLIIEFILHINHRLVNYLAVVPGNPISKGLKESIFVYNTIRNNIVTLTYNYPEIITKALSILEHRSRFFGLTADAIPENENHGDYIVVDPLNTAFEDDDVYDDYERFLANLPN